MKITSSSLFDHSMYIGKKLFENTEFPWEILPKIGSFVNDLGNKLDPSKYDRIKGDDDKFNVWIAKSANVSNKATIIGPVIIDERTEVRPYAYIRGNVLIGKGCVIGNSTEIKNAIIMDHVQIPHYNYVGDSILGNCAHLGAGVKISNLKCMKGEVVINGTYSTGLRKVGAFIGDKVEVGCNSVLNPGTVIGKRSIVYPLTSVRGIIFEDSIVKTGTTIIQRGN